MSELYAVHAFCQGELPWLIDTIEVLARAESPSTDKVAADACGRVLAARLEAIGGRVTPLPRRDRGNHLLAEFGCGISQVLLLGHFDTVWPVGQIERMPVERDASHLRGPGVFDMKAGIALAMLATRALLETGAPLRRRIVMLWTADEEIGSGTSREAIEEEARRSDAVLVAEPSLPGGGVKTARKGIGEFELQVRGVPAHAGLDPGKGASAIHELARLILQLEGLQDLARGVTVNVGIVTGGSRTNVTAETATASVDVRVPSASEAARLDASLRGLRPSDPRTTVSVSGGFNRPPLERSTQVARLYDQARRVAEELSLPPLAEGSAGGGSDGNFTGALGVPTLDGLGAIGDGAHALHEYVELASLPGRAALLGGLMLRV